MLAGIPVARRVFTVFVISGALAGLGGVLFLAQHATVDSTAGTGYELIVITAVVVGGVAIFGGSGNVIGAVLGAILLQVINQALVAARISAFWDSGDRRRAAAGRDLLRPPDQLPRVAGAGGQGGRDLCRVTADRRRAPRRAGRGSRLRLRCALGVGAGRDPDRGR